MRMNDNIVYIINFTTGALVLGYALYLMDGCYRFDKAASVDRRIVALEQELNETKSRMCLPVAPTKE